MGKRSFRAKRNMLLVFFFGITFAYFMWLVWRKLTEVIGNSNIVLAITGGIVLLGIILGYFPIKKLAERFS